MRLTAAVAALVLVAVAPAVQARSADVVDASSVEADGDRVMQLSIVIAAPVAQVWAAYTTAEGWRRQGVGFAHVDLRIGGVIETSYSPDGVLGDPANIKNQIVAYAPERALAIRNIQAPPGFPNAAAFAETSTLIQLEPVDADHTRVTLTAAGFRPEPAFEALYAFFLEGNAWSLRAMRDSFARAD